MKSNLFFETLSGLIKSEWWSSEQMEEYQLAQVQNIVRYSMKHVPFYKELYRKNGIFSDTIVALSDIERLPFIERTDIKADPEKFISDEVRDKKLIKRLSSGSSGSPIQAYSTPDMIDKFSAHTYYYLGFLGLNPDRVKSARITGDKIPEENISNAIYWENRSPLQIAFSTLHLNPDTIQMYVDKLNDFEPTYLVVYPSALELIAKYMTLKSLNFKFDLKCIYSTAETIYQEQKEFLEDFFKCPVYVSYGHTEAAVIGGACPFSEKLHILKQYGVTELLGSDGQEIDIGEKGEVVVTGFINHEFPIIRYRTGDIAEKAIQSCGCGRDCVYLTRVEGRYQDYALDKNNNKVPLATLQHYLYELVMNDPSVVDSPHKSCIIDWQLIDRWQFIQDKPGILRVLLVLHPKFDSSNSDIIPALISGIEDAFYGRFSVNVKIVNHIQPSPSGKQRYIIQNVKIE